jgi:drug/metabolite transporter (DMT)-like permease
MAGAMSHDSHTLPRSTWVLLAALTFGWGFNWPMMKIALAEMPVWSFRGISVVLGAAGLFLIARFSRLSLLPPSDQWGRLALTALFNVTLWNVLIAYGLTLLPAGRSVILAYTMPLWVVLFSAVWLGEPLTLRRAIGIALGMSGMLLLIIRELGAMQAAPLGTALVIAAALSWAVGTVLLKRYPTRMPTTSFTGWQLLIGGVPIVLGALLLDTQRWQPLSPYAAFAVVYNVVVAFVLCYWAWYKLVSTASAGVSAIGTLIIPVVGVFSSMLVLGERPSLAEYLALGLVLAALATVLVPARRTRGAPS